MVNNLKWIVLLANVVHVLEVLFSLWYAQVLCFNTCVFLLTMLVYTFHEMINMLVVINNVFHILIVLNFDICFIHELGPMKVSLW